MWIAAMERCGFKPADIDRMMQELREVFDSPRLDEAQRLYERSTLLTMRHFVPNFK